MPAWLTLTFAPSGLLQVQYSLNRFVKFIGPGLLMSIAYVVSVTAPGGRAPVSRRWCTCMCELHHTARLHEGVPAD